jgi:hypothetical protein
MNKIIGISGVAGAGKDTFFDLLSERIPCEKYSLADELKREVNQWCRMHYHIDSVNCNRDQKEIIRPLLVAHGTTKRKMSKGRHWIEQLHDKVVKGDNSKFKIITDIRYDDYENDEADWIQRELGGVLIHVSQYELCSENLHKPDLGPFVKKFKDPANSEEARNDPKIKKKSDFQIEWEFIKDGRIEELESYIDNFLKWLLDHEKDNASR